MSKRRLVSFLLIALLAVLVSLGGHNLSVAQDANSPLSTAQGTSETAVCPTTTSDGEFLSYKQHKERYDRTRNLNDLLKALVVAEKDFNNQYSLLSQLSLSLDVFGWLKDAHESVGKEKWVPTYREEMKCIENKKTTWLGRIQNLGKPENRAKLQAQANTAFEKINYARSLMLKQKLLRGSSDGDEIENLLSGVLKTAIYSTDHQSARKKWEKAYAFGYLGQWYEQQAIQPDNSNVERRASSRQVLTELANPKKWVGESGVSRSQPLADAEKYTKEAVKIAGFLTVWDVGTYEWQWQLARIYKERERIDEAISAYEATIQTLENMRRQLRSTDSEVQFSFRDQVEPAYREYVSLLLQRGYDSEENLVKARNLIEALQLADLENFLGCDVSITRSADELANEDRTAAIVYPILLPDRIEVILSLPGQGNQRQLIHYATPIPRQEAELILRELRYSLELPYVSSRARELSKTVYRWILQDEATHLQSISTLLFVPDGYLRNIPMAALQDQTSQYLIEKYAVAVAPRLQLLADKPQGNRKALLAALTDKPSTSGFESLKYAQQEIDVIKQSLGVANVESITGQDFTEEKLEARLTSGSYDIIHLATHGEFNFRRGKTFILTTSGKSDKGKVSLDKLEVSFRKTKNLLDLLVLSACETASGDDRDTLGIAGMAVRTGAKSTLSTLWGIEDSSSTELMEQFYKNVKQNLTKSQALREAQIYIIRRSPLREAYKPSHWAPYVLVGDWR